MANAQTKAFVPLSTCLFSIAIFILLSVNVGLLVVVLKGKVRCGVSEAVDIVEKPVLPRADDDYETVIPDNTPKDHPCRDFRLPKHIKPLHYDLLLHPDLEGDSFSGQVNITINVNNETTYLIVHVNRLLNVTESSVLDTQVKERRVKEKFPYPRNEYYVMETGEVLNPGRYILRYKFRGILTNGIVGFYKSTYRNSKNDTRSFAASKFQPTHARKAFPCFDEPGFKSTFSISLVHPSEYTALSNMPSQGTKRYSDSNLVVTKFQKSVPMVTYLAAFAVCDFEYTSVITTNGKPFKVYAVPNKIDQTEYAVNFGSRVLEFYEDYFGVRYTLPKLDMIAFPEWASRATEHWGLIGFRDTYLLYDEENDTPMSLQTTSTVIAHETVHTWMGNLVTAEWWDDIWLHEGFASYLEYLGTQEFHPDWDLMSQFLLLEIKPAMGIDSFFINSQPIIQEVNMRDSIYGVFNSITYRKGASIVRMLEFFMGREHFRKGISNFARKYKYKNAKTDDLWEELSVFYENEENHTISSIMKSWTEHVGYPYVTIKRQNQRFVANQKRYIKAKDMPMFQNSSEETTWSIPLSYTSARGKSGIVWIHEDEEEFILPVASFEWVKFNINYTGFYVVNYEGEEWKKLSDLLISNHKSLSPLDRTGLLYDSFHLAETVLMDYSVFLSVSKYLKEETHYAPWKEISSSFVYLSQRLDLTDTDILLKNYINGLTDQLYQKMEWKTTGDHIHDLLRTTIIELACYIGNRDCLAKASEMFQKWTQGQNIPPDLWDIVVPYGMAEIGREDHLSYLWDKFNSEESTQKRYTYLNAFAMIKIPNLIKRYLEYSMDETTKQAELYYYLGQVAKNAMGRPHVWNFVCEKWPQFSERLLYGIGYLPSLVMSISKYFATDLELKEMKELFAKYPDNSTESFRQNALDAVEDNIKWQKNYKEKIKSWLYEESVA